MNSLTGTSDTSVSEHSELDERRLLNVVSRMIEESGEAALRIKEISKRANVSIGWIYRRFDGREGLVQAARESSISQSFLFTKGHDEEMRAIVDSPTSFDEFVAGMEILFRSIDSPVRSHDRLHQIEQLGSAVSRPDLLVMAEVAQTKALATGEEFVKTAIAKGWLREDLHPRAAALFLQSVVFGQVLGDLDQVGVEQEAWHDLVMTVFSGFLDHNLNRAVA